MSTRRQTEGQKFVSDVVWVGVSQVLMSLTGLAVLPALTKGYPSQIYGIWSQMGATVTLLTIVLTIQFEYAMVRFLAPEEDRDKRRRAFGTMLWPILIFICIAVALSFPWEHSLSMLLFDDTTYAHFIPLSFLWGSMESLIIFLLSYLRARRKIRTLSVIRLALSIAKMSLIVALALAGYSFGWIIGGLIAVEAFFVVIVFAMVVRDIGFPRFSFVGLKSYLSFSAPQIPGSALSWIIASSDRYFITHFLDISQTGIYSASQVLGNMIYLMYWPITMVLFPTLSKLWEQEDMPKVRSHFKYSMKSFLTLAVPAAGGLYILSQPLLAIITTPEFTVGGALVLLVSLGAVLEGIYQINTYVIYLQKRMRWMPLITAIGAVTNACVNIILIPKVGIIGAAISTVASYVVLSAVVLLWARKVTGYELDFKFLSKVVLAAGLMSGCLWFVKVRGVVGIVSVIMIGVVIYGLVLFLLRALSKEDRRLIKELLSGLVIGFKSD